MQVHREIARILERSPSTISRELSRNSLESGRYLGKNAEKVSDARRRLSRKVEKNPKNIQTRIL
ncbi:MAG: helix-turn-helix domain-containing protein [Deltaproteobacteria bacterium]|nr:helix-turn-helix domain-containing protein [Deltaproteobacteria bacterium]